MSDEKKKIVIKFKSIDGKSVQVEGITIDGELTTDDEELIEKLKKWAEGISARPVLKMFNTGDKPVSSVGFGQKSEVEISRKESEELEDEEEEIEVPKDIPEEYKEFYLELMKKTKQELINECEKRGLDGTGWKKTLVKRLIEYKIKMDADDES